MDRGLFCRPDRSAKAAVQSRRRRKENPTLGNLQTRICTILRP
jgi:hypothetical protein